MSFYDVVMRHRTTENVSEMAKRIGRSRTTFRQWQIGEPMAWMIDSVARNLGVDPAQLFREYIEDYRLSHSDEPDELDSLGG